MIAKSLALAILALTIGQYPAFKRHLYLFTKLVGAHHGTGLGGQQIKGSEFMIVRAQRYIGGKSP